MLHTACVPVGPLETNCYLVYTDDSPVAAVIDPGNDAEKICAKAKELGLVFGAILLTHGHFDHIGAVQKLSEGRIPVYLHREDHCMLTNAECNGSVTFGAAPVHCSAPALAAEEGGVISVGSMQFTVLHTPGHSRGSVCYLCEDCLITGDTMFADGYGRTDLFGGNFNELRLSLRRVLPYRHTHRILPGHGNAYEE